MTDCIKTTYYTNVLDDFHELQTVYPFSSLTFAPTAKISEAVVTVVAANRKLIDDMSAERSDFTGKYDRTLRIVIPFDYREKGCKVYGGAWIELEKVQKSDRHFHDHTVNGYQFCVGVPSSFAQLKNVLLENVRTAENMLIAYEQLQKGYTQQMNINAYSHGKAGMMEYERDRFKYHS